MVTDPHLVVHVHVGADTALFVRPYPGEDRVVLHIGDDGYAALFLDRAEIDRFADLLADAKKSLEVRSDLRAAA